MSSKRLFQVTEESKDVLRKLHGLDTKERLSEAVDILYNWIQKQDHIIKKDFSREYLEITIIACKGSVEKAKKQIDSLCTMKTLIPKFFTVTNVKEEFADVFDGAWFAPVPTMTEDKYRVLMIKLVDKSFAAERLIKCLRFCVIMAEYIKAYDYANGFIIIQDFRDINILEILPKVNISDLQQCVTILIEGFGARLKGIHILNESKAVEMLVKLVKQFISEKLGNRIYAHSTVEELHKLIPKEILPIEYGGSEKSVHKLNEECIDELSSKEFMEYLDMMFNAGTDESKRHAGKFNEEYMGMPGSFRNLSVD